MRSQCQIVMCREATYRQPDVAPVHDEHYKTSDARVEAGVAPDHKGDGNDMVCHHLPMVLATSLRIDDKNLVAI